jgi:hypothetical protein
MTSLEFGKATRDLFTALNQSEPDKALLIAWWKVLNAVELKTLENAYDAIIDLQATPTLENVLMRCNAPKPAKEHVKNKDLPKPQAMNLALCGDGRDYARKILNSPQGRPMIAINHAKQVLNIN